MKSKFIISVVLFFLVGIYFFILLTREKTNLNINVSSDLVVDKTWRGYKKYFISDQGRVKRPKENDTVSEGQAYAMLRAVWMGDKDTFDTCYRWTERNLSRKDHTGDNLLAWRWINGAVSDWMPASDADIDYALSLIFADVLWKNAAPPDLPDYGRKAKAILEDVLKLMTYRTQSGRLYLSPWIIKVLVEENKLPVNPSYYSPAHFKVFYEYAADKRWLELADTTYYVLNTLLRDFEGQKGKGLIPDWCAVDQQDRFFEFKDKNSHFGWESVRIPLRVAMDFYWFDSKEAKSFLTSNVLSFVEREWHSQKEVYCEYDYSGTPIKKYTDPLFYASYQCLLEINDSPLAKKFLDKTRSFINRTDGLWIYNSTDDYFANSLAWFAEGFLNGTIRNINE